MPHLLSEKVQLLYYVTPPRCPLVGFGISCPILDMILCGHTQVWHSSINLCCWLFHFIPHLAVDWHWSDATTGNILDSIIIIMKRKEKPTGRWHARNTHLSKQVVLSRIFKRIVPVDYSYQIKEVSGTFSFTCPVTALPVSYLRRLTLCTTLSTSPPGHPGLPATTCIYVVGLLPVELKN